MATTIERRRASLGGELGDVSWVRRSIGGWLRDWGLPGLVDDVALVTSELVTNAILHAGGQIDVVLERRDSGVRVLVSDGCPELVPTRRAPPPIEGPGEDDLDRLARAVFDGTTTGRGLLLVEAFSDAWGADVAPTGKQVWAELGTGRHDDGGHTDEPLVAGGVPVCLVGVPVRLVLLSAGNLDDIVRELQTTDFDKAAPTELAVIGEQLVQQTSSSREPLRRAALDALGRRAHRMDVELEVPPDQVAALRHFVSLTGEVEEMCRAGVLLSQPPSEEVTTFRRWVVDEVDRQVRGGPPTPSPFPD